ncbi:MAG: hypothetical protein WA814_09845 [Candidatus Baltobacteraceae bacterium]
MMNTVATVGTFLVIAATASAAIVQLRHMRGGNQIAVLTELRASQQTPEYLKAVHYVYSELPARMQDPAFRYQLANRIARTVENNQEISYVEIVGDFYENMGVFAKTGLVDRRLLMDIHAAVVLDAWNALIDVTALLRAHYGQAIYENFEYLAVLAQDWNAAHPAGSYPNGVRRIDVPNKWRSADESYASTLEK